MNARAAAPIAHRPVSQRPVLALGLRLMSALALGVLLSLVKISGEMGLALPEVIFWRQLLPAVAILIWFAARGELGRLRTHRLVIHGRRALLGVANMAMLLASARLLPLSEATVLGFTCPLFAVILSALLLRERIGPYRWFAVALGLVGVVVIVGFGTSAMSPLGAVLGIGAAIGGALVAIQIRSLARTEEAITVVFWFSAFGTLILLPVVVLYGSAHTATDWLMLCGISLAGLLTQFCATAALRFGTVSSVMVMDYSQLFWAMLFGWLIFAHAPPASTWIGSPAIIGAGLIVAWREHRARGTIVV
ncbi:MAG TPA: DMT family transporter [Novosphingobium sp.]|nr:DMT family transporter [Novosphingobium sp.]